MDEIFSWMRANELLLTIAGGASVVAVIASIVGIPLLLVRLPSDYFLAERPSWLSRRYAPLRPALFLGKNLLAVVLLACGAAMLVLPGPGLITTLLGLSLLSFPGKRRVELRILRQRHVRGAIDWIRERADRPPLQFPEK